MSDEEYPVPDVDVGSIDPEELWDRLQAGDHVTVLDVRSAGEYGEWHLDGDTIEISNVPYYEFIEGVDDDLLARVPQADPLLVVCAKGGASAYVAGLLIEAGREAVNLADGMNGWADVYVAREVDVDLPSGATLLQYERPSSGCLAYLLVGDGEAAVIDPLRHFVDRYVSDAADRGASLTHAIDTHVHADHVSGLRRLADRTGARTVLPRPALDRGVAFDVDVPIGDGETLSVGPTTVEAIHTPGHTTGMTSLHVDGRVLLTGDGLFVESVARPDLERGDAGQEAFAGTLYDSLHERILPLPDDTVIAPGHASDAADRAPDGTFTATVSALHDAMAVLRMDREAFVRFIVSDMPPRPANYEEIIATNLGHESLGDEEAFRLELGPNNCAASTGSLAGD